MFELAKPFCQLSVAKFFWNICLTAMDMKKTFRLNFVPDDLLCPRQQSFMLKIVNANFRQLERQSFIEWNVSLQGFFFTLIKCQTRNVCFTSSLSLTTTSELSNQTAESVAFLTGFIVDELYLILTNCFAGVLTFGQRTKFITCISESVVYRVDLRQKLLILNGCNFGFWPVSTCSGSWRSGRLEFSRKVRM